MNRWTDALATLALASTPHPSSPLCPRALWALGQAIRQCRLPCVPRTQLCSLDCTQLVKRKEHNFGSTTKSREIMKEEMVREQKRSSCRYPLFRCKSYLMIWKTEIFNKSFLYFTQINILFILRICIESLCWKHSYSAYVTLNYKFKY